MGLAKPYFRTCRPQKQAANFGYSDWAYIHDPEYAEMPQLFLRAFLSIQSDFLRLLEFVEPGDESSKTYSIRIHELLMRTCIEVEANFKGILNSNGYKPPARSKLLGIKHYSLIDKSHRLSSYEVFVPHWNGKGELFQPFKEWASGHSLSWYSAYNQSKHDRVKNFKLANIENLTLSLAALVALLTAQFSNVDFSSGPATLTLGNSHSFYPYESAVGSFFRFKLPDVWSDDEKYDFDWKLLEDESERFQKFDYSPFPLPA